MLQAPEHMVRWAQARECWWVWAHRRLKEELERLGVSADTDTQAISVDELKAAMYYLGFAQHPHAGLVDPCFAGIAVVAKAALDRRRATWVPK